MILDLHVHTTHSSCSRLTLAEILSHARDRGLDGVCITDHNSMAVQSDIKEGLQEDGLCVVVGMEYDTPEGDFLLFGPFDDLKSGLHAEELLRQVEEKGGVAVAAHPCRTNRALDQSLVERGLCRIVESINGRNRRYENHHVTDLVNRFDLVQCGGSDAHQLNELGKTATRFTDPIASRRDLIQALRLGACEPFIPARRESKTDFPL